MTVFQQQSQKSISITKVHNMLDIEYVYSKHGFNLNIYTKPLGLLHSFYQNSVLRTNQSILQYINVFQWLVVTVYNTVQIKLLVSHSSAFGSILSWRALSSWRTSCSWRACIPLFPLVSFISLGVEWAIVICGRKKKLEKWYRLLKYGSLNK